MNRIITWLNLAGVLALAALCAVQWGVNSRMDGQIDQLSRTREEQAGELAKQAGALKQDATDLEDMRQRLTIAEAALRDCQGKLATATAQAGALTGQRDQLKTELDKWTAAVATRDEALKRANDRVEKIGAERDDAVKRLNDLVEKYNAMVKSGKP